jgi:L-threonylcarbamoyladenylate synthase
MEHYFFKDKEYLDIVAKKFEQKSIIIGSTDTILGLMGPVEPWAFNQIAIIKQRDQKPFVVLISGYEEFEMIVDPFHYERIFQFVNTLWPAPLTCIVPLSPLYKPWLFDIQQTIAIRMPSHKGLCQIIEKCGPLFSTSVNISGLPFAQTIEEVDPVIAEQVSLAVLDDPCNFSMIASTIVDLRDKKPVLIRQGVVPFDKIIARN